MNPVLIKIMTNFAIGFEADLSQMLWMWIIEDTIDKKTWLFFVNTMMAALVSPLSNYLLHMFYKQLVSDKQQKG